MPDAPEHREVGRTDPYLDSQRATRGRDTGRLLGVLAGGLRVCWRSDRREFLLLVVVQGLTAALAAGQVLVARKALAPLVDGDGEVRDVLAPLGVLIALTSLSRGATAVAAVRQQVFGETVGLVTWRRIIAVTTRVPLETFERSAFFDQLERIQANALSQPLAVATGVLNLLSGAVRSAAVLVALLSLEPLLVPLLLLPAVPAFLLQRRASRLQYGFVLAQTPGLRRRFALSEVLTDRPAAKEVRAFQVAGELTARHDRLYQQYLAAYRELSRSLTALSLSSVLLTAVGTFFAAAYLVRLVADGEVGAAAAGAAVAAVVLLGGATSDLTGGAGALVRAGLFLRDVEDFTAHPIASEVPVVPREGAATFEELTLQQVGYVYPGASVPALVDVDLRLRRGEVLALVGENGSGKTTLSKVLAGLLTPTSGSILWDGEPWDSSDAGARRSGTAVLFQDFLRYELSAYDNVVLARPGQHDEEQVRRAVAQAGAGFVDRLPDGWQTWLSPRFPGGVDLSGGQWQRIALARVLLREAPFVVLDEPTAALDARAEAALFETVRGVLAGRTVVLVTHRFSSARAADRIAVVHEGRLVELGTHEALMQSGGRYAEMFSLQAAAFSSEARLSAQGPAPAPSDGVRGRQEGA